MAHEPASPAPPIDVAALPPGAPVPEDAIDSELLRLPPPRPRRSPLLAGAVVVLSVLLLYRLHADVLYALQPEKPQDLGEAGLARRGGALPRGVYARLRGTPDYRNALAFEARGGRERSQLFRLRGTGSGVLVVTGNPFTLDPDALRNEWSGRLRRFDDLPYAASVREYYQQKVRSLRALDLSRLQALPDGPLPVPLPAGDRAGGALSVAGGDELLVRVRFPDDLRVLLPKTKFPSEPDARHEVERLGVPAGPGVETPDGYGYVLRVPAGDAAARTALLGKLEAEGWPFAQRIETYRVPLSRAGKTGQGLVVGADVPQPVRYVASGNTLVAAPPGEAVLPWADVTAVEVSAPVNIPADADVLVAGEAPGADRWALPVAALALLFMGFNLWYLWRVATERRQA